MSKGIFGPSQEEIWTQFAYEIEADFISGGVFKTKKVVAKFEKWVITM